MNIQNDLDIQTRVIDINSTKKRYTHEEKIRYLEDAIRNGGYYDDDGTWNSIVIFTGDPHVYRVRVETLIIKDNNFIFLKFLPKEHVKGKRTYLIPGGSIAKEISNIDQAINECKEEARIVVKNIQSVGITYKQITNTPKWAIETQPVNWNGNFTEIYVAEYDKKYTGHIDKVDEDKFMLSGKFYNLDKIFPYLRKEHKDALKVIYPDRFNDSLKTESTKNDRLKILNTALSLLTDAGYSPKVSKQSIDAFINCNKAFISDGSTICISGFKDKDVKKAAELLNNNYNNDVHCSPDNYGTLFLSINSDILTEKALTQKERNALDASNFGIPSLRKFPLHDRAHIIQSIRFFNTVDKKHEKELAYNLIKAMKTYNIDFSIVGERNRLQSYID